jgi:hypothetical protein
MIFTPNSLAYNWAEKLWDASTLDERESAGFKKICTGDELEQWFSSLEETTQQAIIWHVLHMGETGLEQLTQDGPEVITNPIIYEGKRLPFSVVYGPAQTDQYLELRVGLRDSKGNCVGDVFIGGCAEGIPRVLLTTDNSGDGDHSVAVYPTKPHDEAVDLNWE